MASSGHHHIGVCRTVSVSGFGLLLSGFNGFYDLNVRDSKLVYTRRNTTYMLLPIVRSWLSFVETTRTWVLFDAAPGSGRKQLESAGVVHNGRPHIEGKYEDNIVVKYFQETASRIAMIAFPAPNCEFTVYTDATHCIGTPLLKHPGLVLLTTTNNERVPAVHIIKPQSKFTILYSHGNGEDIGVSLPLFEVLSKRTNASVFAYDYVGYSTSKHEGCAPSEGGCYRAITCAWEYLTQQLKIDPKSIVLYGRSIGSGPTTELASRRCCNKAVAGVILESPIRSGAAVLLGSAARLLPYDIFCNIAKLPKVQVPVMVMHGAQDKVVPFENGLKLHQASRNRFEPLWVPKAGHNDMPFDLCAAHIRKFLNSLTRQ